MQHSAWCPRFRGFYIHIYSLFMMRVRDARDRFFEFDIPLSGPENLGEMHPLWRSRPVQVHLNFKNDWWPRCKRAHAMDCFCLREVLNGLSVWLLSKDQLKGASLLCTTKFVERFKIVSAISFLNWLLHWSLVELQPKLTTKQHWTTGKWSIRLI